MRPKKRENEKIKKISNLQKRSEQLIEEGKTKEAIKVHDEMRQLHREVWPFQTD